MARRRSIYDASYQTPLADFLEQIPDYFLKWEALKLQNKKYDNEQAYRAARDKESDRRWDKTQENQAYQRSFDAAKIQLSDELKQISMAPIKQQDALYEKIKPTYIKHPELAGLIDSRISANDAVEGVADKHLDIQSKISDYKGLGKSGRFGSYYDMLEDKQELSKLSKEVQGTSYQSLIDADIAKLDGWLEFSKQNADKPMPKNLWEYELDRTNYNQTAQQRSADMKAADALSGEIATAKSNLITLEGDTESVAYKSALDAINQKQAQLINLVGGADADGNEIKGRIAESNATLYGIEQNNTWNPLGGTTKVLEGGVFGYEPKTEMKEQDVEKYILNNPEEGFDAWMDFITNPSEESENKFSSMLNEFTKGERSRTADVIMQDYTVPGAGDYAVVSRAEKPVIEVDEKPDVDLAITGERELPSVLTSGLKAEKTQEAPVDITATVPLPATKPVPADTVTVPVDTTTVPPVKPTVVTAPPKDEFVGVKETSDSLLKKDGKNINIEGVSSRISNSIKSIEQMKPVYTETKEGTEKKRLLLKSIAREQKKIIDLIEPYISKKTGNFKNKKYNQMFYSRLSKKLNIEESELKRLILNNLEYDLSN